MQASILVAVSCLSLCGCAQIAASHWQSINDQANIIRKNCNEDPFLTTHLAREQCADDKIIPIYTDAKFNDLDLMESYFADRRYLADQIDKKQIDIIQADQKIAEIRTSYVDKSLARHQPDMNAEANRKSAIAAMLLSRPVYQAPAYPTIVPIRQPLMTNCNTVGGSTMCTTN